MATSLSGLPLQQRISKPGWIGFLLIILVFIIHSLPYLNFIVDDAYIGFHYVQNLLQGHGLVFNPGEWVEGYTNFLWLIVLIPWMAFGFDPVWVSKILSFLFAVATMFIGWRFHAHFISNAMLLDTSRTHSKTNAFYLYRDLVSLFTPAGMALSLPLAYYVHAGMETWLFIFLLLLGIYLLYLEVINQKFYGSSIALLLLIMTRPEGLLFVGVLGGFYLLMQIPIKTLHATDRIPKKSSPMQTMYQPIQSTSRRWVCLGIHACILLVGIAGYVGMKYMLYGDIVPNTYYAKVSNIDVSMRMYNGWVYLTRVFSPTGLGYLLLSLIGIGLVWIFFRRTLHSLFMIRDRYVLIMLSILSVIYLVAILFNGGDNLPGFRFVLPVVPLIVLVSGVMLSVSLAHQLFFHPERKNKNPRCAATCRFKAVLMLFFLIASLLPTFFSHERFYLFTSNRVAQMGKRLGIQLHQQLSAPLSDSLQKPAIACSAIGAIAYFSGYQVIDGLGLTNKHIAHTTPDQESQFWRGHAKGDGYYVLSQAPEYILFNNTTGKHTNYITFNNDLNYRGDKTIANTLFFWECYEPIQIPLQQSHEPIIYVGTLLPPLKNPEIKPDAPLSKELTSPYDQYLHDFGLWYRPKFQGISSYTRFEFPEQVQAELYKRKKLSSIEKPNSVFAILTQLDAFMHTLESTQDPEERKKMALDAHILLTSILSEANSLTSYWMYALIFAGSHPTISQETRAKYANFLHQTKDWQVQINRLNERLLVQFAQLLPHNNLRKCLSIIQTYPPELIESPLVSFNYARVLARLQYKDACLTMLQHALSRDQTRIWNFIQRNPDFNPYRHDATFQDLVNRWKPKGNP